jgi:dCMP deaminase
MEWAEFLYGYAEQAAKKSKDTTKVGAALIAPDGKTCLLPAFNGPPAGVRDLPERFERPAKYLYASHAETNAVSFAARLGIRTDGCHLYVTHSCCSACARTLIQAGITKVIYGPGTTSMPSVEFEAARVMFAEAGVEYLPFVCEAA